MIDGFQDHLRGLGLSPRTALTYFQTVRRADGWCTERGVSLEHASAAVLVDYLDGGPRSWSSLKHVRYSLRYYWRYVGRVDPPLSVVRLPRRPRMRCRALSEIEARRLAKYAVAHAGTREALAVLLMLYLGLRREEVASLRWDDFEAGLDRVTVTGKGGYTDSLPLHPVLRQVVAGRRSRGSYVFPGMRGANGARRHVTPATVWNWTSRVAAEAGVDGVTPHRLRHTCLATANDRTGDLRSVQTFARHSDPRTTAGYTRTTEESLLRVVAAIRY